MRTAYPDSCVPRAVAALTGLPIEDVAPRMWGHRQLWWQTHHRDPAGGSFGTPHPAGADLLIRYGFGVDLWDGSGRLEVPAELYPALLRRMVEGKVREVRRQAKRSHVHDSDDDPDGGRLCVDAEEPARLTLKEWMEKVPYGSWIFCVEQGQIAHAIGVAHGNVVAGDTAEAQDFGDLPVRIAYRVIPPTGARP